MINYFRMKRNEWKVKALIYKTILSAIDNQNDIIELIRKLYIALKDTPIEELESELIRNIAVLIHEQAQKEREAEK